MDNRTIKGLNIPGITLGTVQLGIPYGLKEDAREATAEEVRDVLDCAVLSGITSFDTAAAYGSAEEKIGAWLGSGRHENVVVSTKVNGLDTGSEKALIDSMRAEVLKSKERLALDCIPVVMVHHFDEYISNKTSFDRAFAEMKAEGHILRSGISAYSTDDYYQIADSGLDAVQIPVNILDWAAITSGGMNALQESGMIVFARSIYLQGLLLRTPETLPARMKYALGTLLDYISLCEKYGMSQKDLAMSYVRSLPAVSSMVIGCRTAEQVRGNREVYDNTRILTPEQMNEIKHLFEKTDKSITIPMLWPKA